MNIADTHRSILALATLVALNVATTASTACPAGSELALLTLGDSITQANERHDSYRRALWFTLLDGGFDNIDFVGSIDTNFGGPPPTPDFDLDHEGHWGWRADEILTELPGWLAEYTPDIALVHLGSNDMFQDQPIDETILELESIVAVLRADNESMVVLLAQILPHTDPVRNARIDALNAEIPSIARTMSTPESPIVIVDQNTDFNAFADTYDGTHPNLTGEMKMAAKWYASLAVFLEPSQADLDGDGSVGAADLALLLGAWGTCPSPPAICPADLTGDGVVGPADLAILLAHWD